MRLIVIIAAMCFVLGLALGGCGPSEPETPEEMIAVVKESDFGEAYAKYPYFGETSWQVYEDPEHGSFVQFDGLYNLKSVLSQICSETVTEHGVEAVKELNRMRAMQHRALFRIDEEGKVQPAFSGWAVDCADGKQKRFMDNDLNSIKEVMSGTWSSDCNIMLQLAVHSCPTDAELEAQQKAEGEPQQEGAAPAPLETKSRTPMQPGGEQQQ